MGEDTILADIRAAGELPDYEAVEVLWVALVKLANRLPGANEHKRMLALLDKIAPDTLACLLKAPAVESLLGLDPPLETLLAESHERLASDETAAAVQRVRTLRDTDPKDAMLALGEILKRIRNKRAHGFKARNRPRDQEVLCAARAILVALCTACLDEVIWP